MWHSEYSRPISPPTMRPSNGSDVATRPPSPTCLARCSGCVGEGLVDSAVVSIDGTKMEADASSFMNRTRRQLAEEILAEAEREDQTEDELLGERRGDELPNGLHREPTAVSGCVKRCASSMSRGRLTTRASSPSGNDEREGNGQKIRRPAASPTSKRRKDRMANTTDPDSRNLRTGDRYVQGYNAQAAVSGDQVVVAAEVGNTRNDATMFAPMVRAAQANLSAAGAMSPDVVLADTGYSI